MFSSHSPKKNWNRKEIFRKQFSSNCSHGHVEDIFDNYFEKKLIKCQKLFAQSPKNIEKTQDLFSRIFFRSNCSCKHAECSFGSPAALFDKRAKTFCSMPEVIKTLDSPSHDPAGNSLTEWGKGFAQCARMIICAWSFSKKLLKMNLPTGRKQFAHFSAKKFCQKTEMISLISENDKNS